MTKGIESRVFGGSLAGVGWGGGGCWPGNVLLSGTSGCCFRWPKAGSRKRSPSCNPETVSDSRHDIIDTEGQRDIRYNDITGSERIRQIPNTMSHTGHDITDRERIRQIPETMSHNGHDITNSERIRLIPETVSHNGHDITETERVWK